MVHITPYQQQSLDTILKYTPLLGQKILEIGGDTDRNVANKLVELGAADVWSINIAEIFHDQDIGNIHTRQLSANDIERYFTRGAFDVVFGIAILEHIDDIQRLAVQ